MKDKERQLSSHLPADESCEKVMTAPGEKMGSRAAEQDASVGQGVSLGQVLERYGSHTSQLICWFLGKSFTYRAVGEDGAVGGVAFKEMVTMACDQV